MPRSLAAWRPITRRIVVPRARPAGLEYAPPDPGRQRTGGSRADGLLDTRTSVVVHGCDQRAGRSTRVRPLHRRPQAWVQGAAVLDRLRPPVAELARRPA